ncbi:MAG: hypothetical protein ACI4EI_02050 [Muricoprocola sp.]
MAAKKKKDVFHTPQTKGERIKIPYTLQMKVISVISLLLQIALTVFSVYAMRVQKGRAVQLGEEYALQGNYIYLVLPIAGWILTIGFRLACYFLPIDMWRLPIRVKAGIQKTQGKILKLATLLLELEMTVCFFYIEISVFLGYAPRDEIMILWLLAICVTIYLLQKSAIEKSK